MEIVQIHFNWVNINLDLPLFIKNLSHIQLNFTFFSKEVIKTLTLENSKLKINLDFCLFFF